MDVSRKARKKEKRRKNNEEKKVSLSTSGKLPVTDQDRKARIL